MVVRWGLAVLGSALVLTACSSGSPKALGTPEPATPSPTFHAPRATADTSGDISKIATTTVVAKRRTKATCLPVGGYQTTGLLTCGLGSDHETLRLWDLTSNSETALATPRHLVIAASIQGSRIAWWESPSGAWDPPAWRMYALDRQTNKKSYLVGATPPKTVATRFGFTGPVLAGERVVYPVVPMTSNSQRVDLRACRINNCHPKVVARNAWLPAYVGGDDVYFVRGGTSIWRRNLATGTSRKVTTISHGEGTEITGLAGAVDAEGVARLAWSYVTKDRAQGIDVFDIAAHEVWNIPSRSKARGIGLVQGGGRYFSWVGGSANDEIAGSVLDTHTGRIYTVGNSSGYSGSVRLASNSVQWLDDTGKRSRKLSAVILPR